MGNRDDRPVVPIADALDKAVLGIGRVFCWANAILIVVIIVQVVLRYGFGHGLVVLEELEWHLYALAVMMGLSYAMVTDAHVRVDVVRMRLSRRTQSIVEIVGILVFLVPFMVVVLDHSLDFLADSWRTNEHSNAPSGLPWRWAIKAVIPVSFALLALAALSRLIRDFSQLRKA